MKKFYMILAALLIGSVCFAQNLNVPFHKMDNPVNGAERSGYVGNLSGGTYVQMAAGQEYAIAPKQFDANLSGTITKVKFYHGTDGGATNTSYTIKIYNNINLGGTYVAYGFYDLTSSGTAVYTQDYTATEVGFQEVELNTPFTIPSGEFWVAIKLNNAGNMYVGGEASAVNGQYYMQYEETEYNLGTFWVTPNLNPLYSCTLAVYVDDGGAEVVASDFEAKLFGIQVQGDQVGLTQAPDQYTIGLTDDLVIYPFYQNNGPSVATSGTLTATVKLGTSTYGEPVSVTYTAENPGEMNGWDSFYPNLAVTITAAEMDAMGVGNSFDVCYELSYTGNDPTPGNNSFCIPVIRTNAVCDIQAKIYADANGTQEVGTTMTLAPEDNFTIYPAIFNAGPDAAAGTVTVDVQLEGYSILGGAQSMPLSSNPLEANNFRFFLQGNALSYTAAQMDQAQLSGDFEICIITSYSGNDSNTENNTKCITVTRQTAAVEENIAASVSVYPNPANDMFTVANTEGATIVVVNSLGQVVSSIENAASNQTIDASNFANGTYFVKVNESVIKINVVK